MFQFTLICLCYMYQNIITRTNKKVHSGSRKESKVTTSLFKYLINNHHVICLFLLFSHCIHSFQCFNSRKTERVVAIFILSRLQIQCNAREFRLNDIKWLMLVYSCKPADRLIAHIMRFGYSCLLRFAMP